MFGVLVSLTVLAGCGAEEAADTGNPNPDEPAAGSDAVQLPGRDQFVSEGLRPEVSTRERALRTLGRPDSVRSTTIPNRHTPGVTDTLFAVHYPALQLRTHRPGGGGELVSSVDVGENRFLRFPIIGVGRAVIERAFGPPQDVRDGRYVYLCGECMGAEDPVEITFAGERVERVRFTYYVD